MSTPVWLRWAALCVTAHLMIAWAHPSVATSGDGVKGLMTDGSDIWDSYSMTDEFLVEMQALATRSPDRVQYLEAEDPKSGSRAVPMLLFGGSSLPKVGSCPC